jgi:WD40 repeat protein
MLYNAFLSYSHAADGRLAPALQTGLQQFAKPWNRLRAIRVFRDKTGLSATPGLWTAIEAALDGSEYFVLLASPAAAQSHWVQKEVEHWLTHRPAKNILVTLTDGEIVWDAAAGDFDWNATTALPQVLRGRLAEEPLWVDLRWARKSEELFLRNSMFRDVVADLSSALRGIPKDQLAGEDVRQHRKAVRLRRGAIAGLSVLALALALAAFIAVGQKTLAQQNAELARSNEQTANENAERAQANARLAQENEETAKKNELQANENAERAEKNRQQAEDNLKLAQANEKRARENQRLAEKNAAEARRQSERALARQLAAQSEFVRGQRADLPRATLLAVEAVRRYPSAETDQSLRSALDILPRRTRQFELGGQVKEAVFDQQGRTLFVRSETAAQVWDIESGKRLALIESPDRIDAMARSRDGQKLALANHCTVTVYDAKSGRKLASAQLNQMVEPYSVPGCIEFTVMDFSPDGRLIAAAGDALVTRVWNTETGAVTDLRHGRSAPASSVNSVEFSPDGKFLASIRVGDVAVWTTADWKRFDMDDGPPWSNGEKVSFSPESGDYFATVTGYGVAVWANGNTKRYKVMGLPGNNFSSTVAVAFNSEAPDGLNKIFEGNMLAAAVDEDAVVWDLTDGRMGIGAEVARMKHQGPIVSLAFSPDAKRVLTVSEDKTAGVWEARGGKEVARLVHDAPLRAAAFGAGGELWTVDASGIARAWEMPGGSSRASVVEGKPVGISADGGLLAVRENYTGGLTEVWDLRERRDSPEAKPKGRYLAIWGGAREYLAANHMEGGVKVDDLATGKQVLFVKNAEIDENVDDNSFTNGISSMFFSRDGRYIVINMHVWEIASGRKLNVTGAGEKATGLFLSQDAKLAAVRLMDESIRIVELETGRVVARLTLMDIDNSIDLVFSPDGRYLAKTDTPMQVWDLRAPPGHNEIISNNDYELTGEGFTTDSAYFVAKRGFDDVVSLELATRRLTELKHDAYANVLLSPTEPLVAIAWGNTVRLWNPRTGRDLARLDHFEVSNIEFSKNGAYLATGGRDGLLRVWETATQREVARMKHEGSVGNILFSADGRHLVVEAVKPGLVDGDSFVSLLRSEDPAQAACTRLGRSLTADEWNQHLEGRPYRETCPRLQ